ncbi:MAG: sulfite exporter TauE/SafE family protein [Pseudomonadota bacterium]
MDNLLIIVAAFCAGILNTIAGGGTFLTFPALVFIGVPPVIANATSSVAVLPGYLGGAFGFRREIASFDRPALLKLTIVTLIGGSIGSVLLLVSSNQLFSFIVPFLLLAATLTFLFGDQIRSWAADKHKSVTPYGTAGLLVVSIYGGYFNGGLGIILLALFSLWGMSNIHVMNGLKSGLSVVISAVSALIFIIGGLIVWKPAIIMMIAAIIGGYCGAPIARALPAHIIRWLIAAVGFCMSAIFLVRLING